MRITFINDVKILFLYINVGVDKTIMLFLCAASLLKLITQRNYKHKLGKHLFKLFIGILFALQFTKIMKIYNKF